MCSLIGTVIWICVWFYLGAVWLSVNDEDEVKVAAVVYFVPGAVAIVFAGTIC